MTSRTTTSPAVPFANHIGKTLLDRFINYAQSIDAHLFKDDDGTIFKSVTPEGYVEGPCMLKRNGVYHFMWSEGNWGNGTYHVCASASEDPPCINPKGCVILESSDIANGPGITATSASPARTSGALSTTAALSATWNGGTGCCAC